MKFETSIEHELDCGVVVGITLTMWCEEGEPEVRYYPDGSGYPGSPPDCEYLGVTVDWMESGGYRWERSEKLDDFIVLDTLLDGMIKSKAHLRHKLEEDAIDEWNDTFEEF